MKVEAHTDVQIDFPDQQLQKLYLIHHMHHFKDSQEVYHELHHCFLYEKADMEGKKYTISHNSIGNELQHILDEGYTGTLFDHDKNEFKVLDGIISL